MLTACKIFNGHVIKIICLQNGIPDNQNLRFRSYYSWMFHLSVSQIIASDAFKHFWIECKCRHCSPRWYIFCLHTFVIWFRSLIFYYFRFQLQAVNWFLYSYITPIFWVRILYSEKPPIFPIYSYILNIIPIFFSELVAAIPKTLFLLASLAL